MGETPAAHLVPLVERVHARLRPDRVLRPAPHVAFYAYVDTRSTLRHKGDRMHLRLSDHLADAPDAVLEGVVSVLLCRVLGIPESRADPSALAAYKRHVGTERFDERREASRRSRGRKHIDPVGTHRSLLESYLRVTMDMGLTVPEPPRLSWSRTPSRRRFGHWDPAHRCIVVSRVLDDARVPEWVLDYVVYHEILHILHPIEHGHRRNIHTRAFKEAERRFPRLAEAERWIERLAAGRVPKAGRARAVGAPRALAGKDVR